MTPTSVMLWSAALILFALCVWEFLHERRIQRIADRKRWRVESNIQPGRRMSANMSADP